ncbi:MAG: hypothetical protein ACE5KE_08770 [Methanosarcinales archaeon]
MDIIKEVDKVITTGTFAIGVNLDYAPKELLDAMDNATIIISKGMVQNVNQLQIQLVQKLVTMLQN